MTYDDAVIVGIDDGDPDLTVLHWAADEAAFRRARLVVCHVCEWQQGDGPPRPTHTVSTRSIWSPRAPRGHGSS